MKKNRFFLILLLVLVLAAVLYFNGSLGDVLNLASEVAEQALTVTEPAPAKPAEAPAQIEAGLDEDGSYTSAEDLCAYLQQFGHLPPNFITKKEAEALGWDGGSLERVAPGKCIGGDRFGNREGLLPSAKGRNWTECDVNTLGARSRGAERLVFSNDGLIYYTGDHYESFQLMAGEP